MDGNSKSASLSRSPPVLEFREMRSTSRHLLPPLLLLLSIQFATAAPPPALAKRIEKILAEPQLARGFFGIEVVSLRTGKRLFFVPNVFDAATKPIFTATKRQSDVYVSFPWKESEQILIEIPKGFSLESGDAPSPFSDQTGIMKYAPEISLSKDKKFLLYKREFSFGNGGYIRFNPKAYPTLKQMFEIVNKGDLHQLTLRQDDKATAAAQ